MKVSEVQDGFYQLNLGFVNAFLVNSSSGLTLIDTGMAKHAVDILQAIKQIGFKVNDLKQIILTHLHPDHIGSASKLQNMSGAKVFAHAIDALQIEKGMGSRAEKPLKPSPGLLSHIFAVLMPLVSSPKVDPVHIDVRLNDGDYIDNNFEVVFTPGHSAGHICLIYNGVAGRVLIAGDLCMNLHGLNWSFMYEDREVGRNSINKIKKINFEKAVFGHGMPILKLASEEIGKASFC